LEVIKQRSKTRQMTVIAVMTALTFVVTWLVKVPIPGTSGGYLNFGDIVIYMGAFLLGGPSAALFAGVGSMFADFAVGAGAVYAVPTLVIKALMGLIVGSMTAKQSLPRYILACVLGGAVMVAGYGVYEWVMFDAAYAVASLPFNLVQWAGSVIMASVLYGAVKRLGGHYQFRRKDG